MNRRSLATLLALVLVVGALAGVAGCAPAAEPPAEPPAAEEPMTGDMTQDEMAMVAENRNALFISVADLASDTTQFVLLDARDPKAYEAGHIEGAVSAPWQTFSSVGTGTPGDADWGTLLPAEEIAAAFGKLGVDTSKTIVIYSDPTGWGEDGRVAWTLQSIGYENVRLLDGGFPAWTAGGNAASTEVPTPPATTVAVVADRRADINVSTAQVKEAVDSKSAIILDVRSTKEFEGATDFGEARGGRLPGAINIPFADNFNEDGTLKSDDELMAMYMDAGIPMDATVYAYCTKGIRSAYVFELLEMLAFETPRNYDASFYSWAGDSALPLEK